MEFRNVSEIELKEALRLLNAEYKGNITFNRFDIERSLIRATLRVIDSKKVGSRLSYSGRRLTSACWHVHGRFFEIVLKINPNAKITTSFARIDKNGGNWEDKDIGSMINPLMFSEACQCEGTTQKQLKNRLAQSYKAFMPKQPEKQELNEKVKWI